MNNGESGQSATEWRKLPFTSDSHTFPSEQFQVRKQKFTRNVHCFGSTGDSSPWLGIAPRDQYLALLPSLYGEIRGSSTKSEGGGEGVESPARSR